MAVVVPLMERLNDGRPVDDSRAQTSCAPHEPIVEPCAADREGRNVLEQAAVEKEPVDRQWAAGDAATRHCTLPVRGGAVQRLAYVNVERLADDEER